MQPEAHRPEHSHPAEQMPQAGAEAASARKAADDLLDVVKADSVNLSQAGVNRVYAENAALSQSLANTVDGDSVHIHQGGAALARADSLVVEQGGVGAVFASRVQLSQSGAGVLVANQVELSHSRALVVLAREVHGTVETLLDTRGAALAGLVAGAAVGLALIVGGLLGRRRR